MPNTNGDEITFKWKWSTLAKPLFAIFLVTKITKDALYKTYRLVS